MQAEFSLEPGSVNEPQIYFSPGRGFFMLDSMRTIPIGPTSLRSSRLAYGCWRLAGTWDPKEVTPEREAQGRRAVIAA